MPHCAGGPISSLSANPVGKHTLVTKGGQCLIHRAGMQCHAAGDTAVWAAQFGELLPDMAAFLAASLQRAFQAGGRVEAVICGDGFPGSIRRLLTWAGELCNHHCAEPPTHHPGIEASPAQGAWSCLLGPLTNQHYH